MSTKRLAIRGVLSGWVGRICAIVISFVVAPILVDKLGDEGFGLWTIILSMTSYYGLIDLGFRVAAIKFISEYEAAKDRESINKVICTSLMMNLLMAAVLMLIVPLIAWGFSGVIEIGDQDPWVVSTVIILCGANLALGIIGEVFGATLSAFNRFDIVNAITVATRLILSVSMVCVLWLGGGLLGMAISMLSVGIVTQTVQFFLARQQFPEMTFSRKFVSREMLGRLMNFSLLQVFVKIVAKLNTYSGPIIIGYFLGAGVVTYYAISEGLVRHLRQLAQAISKVTMPVASGLASENRRDDLQKVLVMAPRILLSFSLLMAVVYVALGSQFLDLYMRPGFSVEAYPVLCILAFARVLSIPMTGVRAILTGMGQMRVIALLAIAEAILMLGCGISFVYYNQSIQGMAYGVFCAQILTSGTLLPYYACRMLEYPYFRFVLEVGAPAIVANLPAAALAWVFVQFLPTESIVVLVGQMLLVGGVTVVSSFFICMDASFRSDIIRSLTFKFKLKPGTPA